MRIKKVFDWGHRQLWKVKVFVQETMRQIRYRKLLKSNRELNNKYHGRRCFIIGTGPSLTIADLETIRRNNEVSFASNRIFKFYDKTSWRPNYYTVCDRKVFLDSVSYIKQMETETDLFFPLDFYDGFSLDGKVKCRPFSRYVTRFFSDSPSFSADLSKRFGEGGTVTYHLIQMAVAMGFSEIYLLGIDFSYSNCIGPDGKPFVDFSIKDYSVEERKALYTVPNLYLSLLAYKRAKKYTDSHGIKIYNATRGGKLEIFERVNFDSLF